MKRAIVDIIRNLEQRSILLKKVHVIYTLLKKAPFNDLIKLKKLKLFFKVHPYTMVSYHGLSNTYELARIAERNNIQGCFIECGVWRGGCAAVMAHVVHKAGSNRKVHLFDSFEGLPEPIEKDGAKAIMYAENRVGGKLSSIGKCVARREDVEYLFFTLLKMKRENIAIHQGWFQDTIPGIKEEIGPVALLRLDCDWYESTKVCLDCLYDNVVSGGFVIIDDYNAWDGCKIAVDKFSKSRKDTIEMIPIDQTAVYFQKP